MYGMIDMVNTCFDMAIIFAHLKNICKEKLKKHGTQNLRQSPHQTCIRALHPVDCPAETDPTETGQFVTCLFIRSK